jgi:cell division protein FtsB
MKQHTGSLTGRAAILAAVLVLLMLTLAVPVRNWFTQRAEITALASDLEATEQRVADLLIQKERWEDPAFIAAEARKRLHFVLPGETGYVTIGGVVTEDSVEVDVGSEPAAPWFELIQQAVVEIDRGPEPE